MNPTANPIMIYRERERKRKDLVNKMAAYLGPRPFFFCDMIDLPEI
jgi:hypothetical protein